MLRYILNEIKLGIEDNILSIWNIFRHPIDTLNSLYMVFRHPIITFNNIYFFATNAPIRFSTNLLLSILEGKIISLAWENAFAAPSSNMCQIKIANASATTTESSSSFLPYFPISSLTEIPAICSSGTCFRPAASMATTSPLFQGAASALTQINKDDHHERERLS